MHQIAPDELLRAALSIGTSLEPARNAEVFLDTLSDVLNAGWYACWRTQETGYAADLLVLRGADAPRAVPTAAFSGLPAEPAMVAGRNLRGLVRGVDEALYWPMQGCVLLLGCSLEAEGREQLRTLLERFKASVDMGAVEVPESLAGFRSLVESAGDLVFRADLDGRFTYANPVALQTVGLSREEVVEASYLDFVHEDQRAFIKEFYERQVEEGVESSYQEVLVVAGDGREVWLGQNVWLDRVDDQIVGIAAIGRDLTVQKRSELDRDESERKYRGLFDHSSDAIILHDLEGLIKDLNQKAEAMLGFSKADLVGQPVHNLHPTETKQRAKGWFERIRDTGEVTFEAEFLRADGSVVETEVASSLIVSQDQTLVLGIIRDMTDRLRAQRELVDLKNLYEQVLSAIPSQIALFDRDARYVYVTPSGIKDPEVRQWIIGKTNEEYCAWRGVDPEVGRRRSENILRVIETGERFEMEETFQDREGKTRHYFRFIDAIRDLDGNVIQALGWGIEVTQLKEAQAALLASEVRKSAVLETALDCIISIDSEGRIVDFNPAAERTFGFSADEVVGGLMSDYIVPHHHRKAHEAGMKHYLATGEGPVLGQRIEITAINKQGHEFPIELSIQPLEIEEKKLFTAYLRDISKRKQSEEDLLEANRRAAESAAAKERFLANMSHEMRTPLNAVIGMSHLLLDTALDEEQARYLRTMQFSSDSLLALINDLLDFAKLEAGAVTFESVPFRLADVVEGVSDTFRFRAEKEGLGFRVTVDPDVPDWFTGDPVRLGQILSNLISNGVKFTEEGQVALDVRLLDQTEEHARLEFRVEDTGIGVADSQRESIFESFTQASSETTRLYGGTGLGLAIVRELVDLQGGRISMHSEPGNGSIFVVQLTYPLAGEVPVAAADADGEADLTGYQILVVEDNEVNQMVVCGMLHRWGADTIVANNGQEALDRLEEGPVDLVLMDVQMPVMDGHQACIEIRRTRQPDDLPIVALTASTAPAERERLLRAGMQDFIMKPFRPADLRQRIAVLLTGEPRLSPSAHTPMTHASLVDEAMLDEMAMGNRDLKRKLVGMFLEQDATHHAALHAHVEAGGLEGIRQLAHKLKSSAGMLGAGQLQEAFRELEDRAKSGELPTPGDVQALDHTWKQTSEQLSTLLRSLEGEKNS